MHDLIGVYKSQPFPDYTTVEVLAASGWISVWLIDYFIMLY